MSFTSGTSQAHLRAIGLPEAAHGSLRHAALAGIGIGAAHFDHGFFTGCARDAALDETADTAVFHRDVAGRTDEIGLLQADHALLRRVLGEAEQGPVQIGAVDAARHDLAYRDRVLDLLQ